MTQSIKISRDEWWPYYYLDEQANSSFCRTVEVDPSFLARMSAAHLEISLVQEELDKLYEKAK